MQGCLLLATEEIWSGPFHQSVILVLSHHQELGTVGLILNRPGVQRLNSLAGLKSDLAEVFADSQVHIIIPPRCLLPPFLSNAWNSYCHERTSQMK